MSNANLYSLFRSRFLDDQVFIRSPSGEDWFTYGDLDNYSAQLANHFLSLGIRKGDRVLVQVEKSPQALFVYFACLRAGFIYLPLNNAYLRHELVYFIGDADPSLIICDPTNQLLFAEITATPILTLDAKGQGTITTAFQNTSSDHHACFCQTNDVAAIIYTSGTTGKPKGAMISHGNLSANGLALAEKWSWQPDDVMLHVLPIFHIHGLFIATHLPVLHGSPIIYLDKFEPESVISNLPLATAFMGVPTHYIRLLDHPNFNRQSCRNIRVFTSGSAPMLVQTHKAFKAHTGHDIVERYGMTEAGIITTNAIHGGVKIGTVGKPMPGVELRVVKDDGQVCQDDEIGTIQVRGAGVFQGYWRMPEKTQQEFTDDGFFITGDLGSLDQNGFLSISGRGKDLIITGGLNVYPKELELIIDQLPGVVESAVIGLPHRDFGEAVTTVIVPEKNLNLTAEAVIQQLKQQIASFKVPKAIHFIDALPRNTMGKVQKNKLRELFKDS